jgi:hypothetical protein
VPHLGLLLVSLGLDRAVQRGLGDLERPAYFRNRVFLLVEFKGNTALFYGEGFWSAAFSASGSGCCQTCGCSLPNEVSFKFCECSENMEDEFSAAGCGVNVLSEAFEPNPRFSRSAIVVIRCGRERPKRSNLQTTKVSLFLTQPSASSNPMRSVFAPLAVSVKIFLHPL